MDFYQTETLARSGSQLLCSPGYGGPLSSGQFAFMEDTTNWDDGQRLSLKEQQQQKTGGKGGGGVCVHCTYSERILFYYFFIFSIFFVWNIEDTHRYKYYGQ